MNKKTRPLYLKLLIPMLVLILVETALLAGSVFGGGLIGYMEDNEIEVLHEFLTWDTGVNRIASLRQIRMLFPILFR